MRQRKFNNNGYTLLELCVTLAIICITAAIVYPVICPPHSEKSRQVVCMSHLKQIGLAVVMYAQDNDDTLPPATAPEYPQSPYASPRLRFWLGSREKSAQYYRGFQTKNGFLTSYLKNEALCWCPTQDYGSLQAQRYWNTGNTD